MGYTHIGQNPNAYNIYTVSLPPYKAKQICYFKEFEQGCTHGLVGKCLKLFFLIHHGQLEKYVIK